MSTRSTFTAMAIALVAASFTGMAQSAEPKVDAARGLKSFPVKGSPAPDYVPPGKVPQNP